ncbi:MAG: VCBS repeat-containing protein [Pseudomonadota bacterium]
MRRIAVCLVLVMAGPAAGQVLDDARGHEDGCDRPAPPPFSEVVTSDQGPVVAARYFGASDAYAHGVLGDAIEATGLLVRYDNGSKVVCDTVQAGPDRVFEDTQPRLVDLTGDGVNEVIAVASHANQGARLEVYGYPELGQDFQLLAHTPYIGTSFRWLAPLGAADLDGDGYMEIAYIDRPHLAKMLRIWRYKDGALSEIATQQGYSNHKIGWPFIVGGLRDCGAGPEMILATGNWSRVVAARLQGDIVVTRDLGAYWSPESVQDALICQSGIE